MITAKNSNTVTLANRIERFANIGVIERLLHMIVVDIRAYVITADRNFINIKGRLKYLYEMKSHILKLAI